jgi:hypothetical protein
MLNVQAKSDVIMVNLANVIEVPEVYALSIMEVEP